MTPPPIILDAQAISGITGSISLACWIIVFAPQIYENFQRKSSEGLSLLFIILWLAGDVFNVLGSILQGVLPTMIILAVYYTLADIVLLWQCLLYGSGNNPDYIHLSPANPMGTDVLEAVISNEDSETCETSGISEDDDDDLTQVALSPPPPRKIDGSLVSALSSALFKGLMIFLVILAGLLGWYVSYVREQRHHGQHPHKHHKPQDLVFDPVAQFFGWLCAILYLGSRVPQILLNYRRKSCEGISFMFFLFACIGNLTYVISILAIDMSWYYLWVNSSWLTGSFGTLALDFTIFVQFFLYNESEEELSVSDELILSATPQNTYGSS